MVGSVLEDEGFGCWGVVWVCGEVVVGEKQLLVSDVVEKGHCHLFVGFKLELGVDHLKIVGGLGVNMSLVPVEVGGIGILLIRDVCSHGGGVVGGFGGVWGVVWSGLHNQLWLWHFRGGSTSSEESRYARSADNPPSNKGWGCRVAVVLCARLLLCYLGLGLL